MNAFVHYHHTPYMRPFFQSNKTIIPFTKTKKVPLMTWRRRKWTPLLCLYSIIQKVFCQSFFWTFFKIKIQNRSPPQKDRASAALQKKQRKGVPAAVQNSRLPPDSLRLTSVISADKYRVIRQNSRISAVSFALSPQHFHPSLLSLYILSLILLYGILKHLSSTKWSNLFLIIHEMTKYREINREIFVKTARIKFFLAKVLTNF